MQPFLAFGCVAGFVAAAVFFSLWRGALASANHNYDAAIDLHNQLRQKTVEHDQAKLEIDRRREADDFQASKRSAAVSKGNRVRYAKRAAEQAA